MNLQRFRLERFYILFAIMFISILSQDVFSQEKIQRLDSINNKIDNNFFKIREECFRYWDTIGVDQRKGEFRQFNRWLYFWENRVSKDGKFPTNDLYLNGWKKIKEEETFLKDNKTLSMPTWTELGPNADPVGSRLNSGVGRVNVIKANPKDHNEIWAGSASGGVWKSTDAGKNWKPLAQTEFMSLGVSDIAIAPSNPSTVYVATGDNDGYFGSYACYSIGIIKSTDGGKTWDIAGEELNLAEGRLISRVWVHPNNENILIAASNKGMMKSTNGGRTWKNTTNQNIHFADLEQKPDDYNTFYASTMTRILTGQAGFQLSSYVYRSTDGGETWEIIQTINDARRTCIAVTPALPDVLYVLSANREGGFLSLIASSDGGNSFEEVNTFAKNKKNYLDWANASNSTKGQGFYDLALEVHPNDSSVVYIGGINIWKSTNAGFDFSLVAHWVGGYNAAYVHADIHDLRYVGNRIYSGHDGGIDYSDDDGKTWIPLNKGLGITQFYRFTNSRQSPYNIIAGSQDNGTRGFKNNNWRAVAGGDGMDCAFDPKDENTFYSSVYYGGFVRHRNGEKKEIISPNIVWKNFQTADTGAWITPIAVDAQNPNNIYIGYVNLYHSKDYGNTWRKLTNMQYSSGNQYRNIKVSESNGKYIYASKNTILYKSKDGGENFEVMLGIPGTGNISDIHIHPTNPEIIYITRSGYNEQFRVLKYDGQQWINMSGNLPNVPANCIWYQRNSDDRIYVGTDIGVYSCDKNTPYYRRWGEGLPLLCVTELEEVEQLQKIRAATYGRGIWEVDINNCKTGTITIKNEGQNSFCKGDSVRLFIVEKDAKNIQWSTGETTSEIWVKNSGDYWAVSNINSDCPKVSNRIEINVETFRELEITTDKSPDMCEGDSISLSIPLGFNPDSYKWSTGSNERKIVVREPGIYWGSASSGTSSCVSYDTIVVRTYPKAKKPTITIFTGKTEGNVKYPDTLMVTPEAAKYRWYLNGKLTDIKRQRFTCYASGDYTVEISNGGECWSASADAVKSIIETNRTDIAFDITPNPAKFAVTLQFNKAIERPCNIFILDATGKTLLEFINVAIEKTFDIDVSNLANGTYFVRVASDNLLLNKQFIKE